MSQSGLPHSDSPHSGSAHADSDPMPMSTYSIEKLLHLWRQEGITADQAIGHMLQHIAMLENQDQRLQKQMQRVQQQLKL